MRQVLTTTAAAAVALLAALPASAAVISYTSWYSAANGPGPASTPQTYTQTDWTGVTQKIRVPQFDSALGTLTAATLSLYADANATGSVTNPGPGTVNVKSYSAALRVRLLSPSNSTTGPGIDSPATVSTPFLVEALPPLVAIGSRTVAPKASVPFSLSGKAGTSTALNLLASGSLPFFLGTGQATLPVYTGTRIVSSITGGNLVVSQSTSARAEAVVTYTYTAAPPPDPTPPDPTPVPVPEPVSAALLGTALLGLGLLRRR